MSDLSAEIPSSRRFPSWKAIPDFRDRSRVGQVFPEAMAAADAERSYRPLES
jgi:hypothetical protein